MSLAAALSPYCARVPTDSQDPTEVLWELDELARAHRLGDWMFEQFSPKVGPRAAEVGAGVGTFSGRLLDAGVEDLLLVEPHAECVDRLARRFEHDDRVRAVAEELPLAPTLAEGSFDFVLCQNVLEHIEAHEAAVNAMAEALRPGGHLGLLVPAHPRLFGRLDRAFGHHRRYTRDVLERLVSGAQPRLELVDLYSFNLLGVAGWVVANRRRTPSIGSGSLRAYELLVRPWRRLERRVRPPWGLSLIAIARRAPEES